MRKGLRFAVLLGLSALAATPASASETVVVPDIAGPEGPLIVDGLLYYVAWNPGSLSRWDGKASKVLNTAAGCSHNGLALTRQKTLLLACSDAHGAILELDLDGR